MKPKKRFGQHFFNDPLFLLDCLEKMDLTSQDTVIEIGPGKGVLTELLLEKVSQVVAIEIDTDLYNFLLDEFSYSNQLTLINHDFLELSNDEFKGLSPDNYPKVVANIPYYITSPIIMKLLNETHFKEFEITENTRICSDIYIMIQAEVAKRILATPDNKDYGKLTIAVQYAAEVELIAWIDRSYFYPIPNVDSAFIRLKPRVTPLCEIDSLTEFWNLVNAIFQSRRKTLKNSLKRMGINQDLLEILDNKYDLSIRGESLSIEDLAYLSDLISTYKNS